MIFVGTVIAVQLTTVYMSVGWLFILYMIYLLRHVSRGVRDVSLLSMLYLLGYWLCVYLSVYIKEYLNLLDPLIWKGVKDPIWRFLLIASCVVIFSFSFVIDYSPENLDSLLWFGLLFALINSVLEEILWRGLILSRFVDVLGEKLGLIIVSIGFGMYHYSIGFPWSVCALFSIFGMLLGGITIRSKGLLPVMILHFIMNMLFVFSGLIFNM